MTTEEHLSTREVAEIFHVAPSSVTRWVRRGLLLPAFRTPGGTLRFNRSDVETLRDAPIEEVAS